jgi:serine/threonine protein kinase
MSTSRAPAHNDQRAADGTTELRNYQLHERLSQEELATVYRATHLALDRPVRVHLLRRQDWISSSRFQLAARLAARLSHPNLVSVIDAGHDERYGDYLVTPQLDARPLSTILADAPLQPLAAARIASQIASALDYLHSQQVYHRDVQPANIFVSAEGVAYLANLSLAASPDTPDLSSIDEADYLTPYSAPEQRLTRGEAGAALDVYSLGAVVYHMLSGEVPPAPNIELPSLAGRDPTLAAADRVVRRMIAPQPNVRFSTAAAAAAALRQALRSQIDQATADMEESRWEASAEWLENPVETALGGTLNESFSEFLARARKRADDLHRRDVIRRTLNRWSRNGFFRRRTLGQLIVPEQIVSYNVYFFELRALFESRTPLEARLRPCTSEDRSANQPPPDLWSAPVPHNDTFDPISPQEILLPHSTRILSCPECNGATVVPCTACKGSGTVEKVRKVSTPENRSVNETLTSSCSACHGYGRQQCLKCAGTGSLVQEQLFTWERRARLFENTDDISDLPELAIKRRLEPVFAGLVNPYEGRWHSVAPLAELLRAAIAEAGNDTRLIAAELKIKGATITEMDFLLDEKPQRLYFVGFDNELVGDWSLLNPERLLVAALVALLTIIALLSLVVFAL